MGGGETSTNTPVTWCTERPRVTGSPLQKCPVSLGFASLRGQQVAGAQVGRLAGSEAAAQGGSRGREEVYRFHLDKRSEAGEHPGGCLPAGSPSTENMNQKSGCWPGSGGGGAGL